MAFPPNILDNHHESLVYLPEAAFAHLLAAGRLSYNLSAGLRGYGDGLVLPEEPEISFETAPAAAVDCFLDTARWVRPGGLGELLLVDPAPLRQLILRKLAAERQALPRIPIEGLKVRSKAQGFRPNEAVAQAVSATGSYIGASGICTCGEPGCGSAFTWIQDRVILLELTTTGDHPRHIRLLPGEIVG